MLDDTLNLIGDIEIFVAGAGAIVFAVSYAVFFRWRKTSAGRALMYFVLSLVALFMLNALGRWTEGDYPFREYIRVTTYSALVVTVWRLVWVLWRNWRGGSERPLDVVTRKSKEETRENEMKDAEKIISPKVIASAVTSILLVAVIAAIGAITPELFAFLGAWAPVVYAAVVSVGATLAGFIKTDPLRK